jgi:glycine hydroxymethyltransferase
MLERMRRFLNNYFVRVPEEERSTAVIASLAAIDAVGEVAPEIAEKIVQEMRDQRARLKLIASENYCSLPVQLAMGNWLTDKYAEGYPQHRFYAGCENVDAIEARAVHLAKQLFGAEHAYVQPHSGIDANLVAFWAILIERVQSKEVQALGKKSIDEMTPEEYEQVRRLLVSQKLMGMALSSGGHLTHGYRHNVSSKMFQSVSYGVSAKTGRLDYDELALQVKREKPLILIAGYSAYPRLIDFAKMREIADSVGAVLLVDMAHFSGLVAGKALKGNFDPIPFAQVVTSTTHKTLRGPRGGMILCNQEFQEAVHKGCPLVLGGPLPHVIAAKAIAFQEALSPDFQLYAQKVIDNARALAEGLMKRGAAIVTDGTDNHLVVLDVMTSFQLTGRQAENALTEAHLTTSRNMVPWDPNGPWYTSGIRMGTAALTTRGLGTGEMDEIASIVVDLLRHVQPQEGSRAKVVIPKEILRKSQERIASLLSHFPLYPELLID